MTVVAPRKVIIDTDTASDDAVALIMALRSPRVEIVGITIVAGNVSVDQGTRNALYTVELCGSTVPVFTGAASPLTRPLQQADWFHGRDGLGDHGYRSSRLPAEEPAIESLIRLIAKHPGVEILTLGPLTNLALALLLRPDLVRNVSKCLVMGGAPCCEGNVSPAAEYNFWVDPEAARIICRSQLPIELVGWQLSRGAAVINAAEIEELLALKTTVAEFAIRSNDAAAAAYQRQTGEIGIALPDPIAWPCFSTLPLSPLLLRITSTYRLIMG
jgi:purine nucleosidase